MQNIRRQDCEEWKRNPLRNPLTGRAIQKGKGVYTELKRNCNDKYGITDDEKVNNQIDVNARDFEKEEKYPENVKSVTKQMNKLNLDTEPTNILPDSIRQQLLEQDRIYNEVPLLERIKEFRDLIWMNDFTEENFGKLFTDRINYYELFRLNNIYIKDLILHNPYFIPTPQGNYDVLFKALDHLYENDEEWLKILSYYRQPEVYQRLINDYTKHFGISTNYEELVIKMFDVLENIRRYPDLTDMQIFKQFVTNDNNLKFSTSYIKISIKCLLNNYKELNRGYPSVITPKKIEMYLTVSCAEYIKFYKYLEKNYFYPRFDSLKEFLNDEMIKCILTSKECPKLTTQQDKEYYDYVFYSLWSDMASYLNNNPNDILNFFNCMLEENYEFMSLQINKYNLPFVKVIDFVIKDYYESIQQMDNHEGYINKEKIDRKIKERFINNILKYNIELDLQTGITNAVNAINKYIFEIYNKKGRIYIRDGVIKQTHVSYITQEDLDKFLKYFLENINITLPFIEYITYKNSIPFLKDYKDRITKESIVQFLDRSEPTREEVQEWRDLWAQQNPDDNNPPPPPDWWLRGRTADVHTKRHVAITDCRIKLLFERLPNDLDINQIPEILDLKTGGFQLFLVTVKN